MLSAFLSFKKAADLVLSDSDCRYIVCALRTNAETGDNHVTGLGHQITGQDIQIAILYLAKNLTENKTCLCNTCEKRRRLAHHIVEIFPIPL